ncbi:MAG: TetR/AcrR family transcriptional regulator, partial [Nonomuraea sp.]|nr:TetR/AcrR family transcriptional regulator [Nonomuraea sp.]
MSSKRAVSGARRSGAAPGSAELRARILAATRDLLRGRGFDSLSVADILTAAEVSRASFYFYFPGKQAVLAELVREAVAQGQQAAQPWIGGEHDPADALRAGVRDGARLWRENAGV